jgi:hypothetical protein
VSKFILPVFILSFFISCESDRSNKIEEVSINATYYRHALDEVSRAYDENPTDEFLRRKLYFLTQLNWPKGAVQTLEEAQNRFGLTDEIVHNLAAYYLSREDYPELTVLIKDWKRYSNLDRELSRIEIDLIVQNNLSKLSDAIFSYSQDYEEENDLAFLKSKLYFLSDTAATLLKIKEMATVDPNNFLVNHWLVPVFFARNQNKEAQEYLFRELKIERNDQTLELLANSFRNNRKDTAKIIFRSIQNISAYEQLSEVFESEKRYDSAIFYVEKMISLDSTRNFIFRKADLYEKRRWLTTSYYFFNLLAQADLADTISRMRAQIVANKIAYLRSLEELEVDVPILELKPKKQLENE